MTIPTAPTQKAPPIESRDQLIASFARGEKPKDRWRIGTEHEKFVYRTADRAAPSYDEPGGIRDLLGAMTEYGWRPVEETGPDGTNVIALNGDDGSVSLEPNRSRPRGKSWDSASWVWACGPTRRAPSCR
jgi:glutamate--cysteine ligase